jgi:hypothetical protein
MSFFANYPPAGEVFNKDSSGNVIIAESGWKVVNVSTTIDVTNVSTALLQENLNRRYLYIANNSASMIYIQLGNTAVYGMGIRIAAGGIFIMSGSELFLGQINGIGQNSNLIDVLEGV